MRCFVDLDGVLCDFVRPAVRAHGQYPGDYYLDPGSWPAPGQRDLWPWMGLASEKEFWRPLLNPAFWRTLPLTPDARRIRDAVEAKHYAGGVHLLSSPQLDPSSYAGRVEWVRMWLPQYTRRAVLTDCKAACAHRGALLIDDSDEQVQAFRDAGGWAILLPRAWNSRHAEACDPVGALKRDLDRHAVESFHFGR